MYADRYTQGTRFNPAGLTAAVAINAAVIAALMFAAPGVIPHLKSKILEVYSVPPDAPPPPETPPKPIERTATRPTETIPLPTPAVPTRSDFTLPDQPVLLPLPPGGPIDGVGTGPVVVDPPAPPPPLPFVEPGIDPRYARDLQPTYPPAERRAGREGRVSIRVLVGVDGRVKRAERLSATTDAFWQATLERALSKWRFKPATRGGIPVEGWRTLSLTFVLEE